MAGQTGCDWDYNDRVWLMMVREIGPEVVVYSGSSTTWTAGPNGTATVALTVTENKPGYEGRYFWSYTVTNVDFLLLSPLTQMSLSVSEVGGLDDLTNSLGWVGSVTVNTNAPHLVRWEASGGQTPLGTGQSATFSFTTPVTGIGEASGQMGFFHPPPPPGLPGAIADPVAPSGAAKGPELMIRSVTLWGQPGAPSLQGALGGGMATLSGTVLGNNPNAGGGKRIFPERPTWGNTVRSFEEVDVRVELSQPVAVAKNVNLYQFDVDDPSTNNDLVDWELNEYDNRDSFVDHTQGFVSGFVVTVGAGNSSGGTLQQVGRQPGDNYRFVATIDPAVTFHSSGGGLKDVDIFREHFFPPDDPENPAFVVVYDDGARAGVYFTGGYGDAVAAGDATTVTSTLLTTWRKLHVERDIMDAPPSGEPFSAAGFVRPGSGQEGDQEGDDDVEPDGPDGTVPKPGIGMMQAHYRDVYIEVVDDLDGINTSKTIPFVHNMNTDLVGFGPASAAFNNSVVDDKYWCFQLIGGYERETNKDHDGPDNPLASDGATRTGQKISFVYMEVARDCWESRPAAVKAAVPFANYVQRVAFHESVHIFGFEHEVDDWADEGPLSILNNNNGTDESNRFTPGQVAVIRSKTRPG